MLTQNHRLAILLHGGIKGTIGKTGLALLRYREGPIVAVIDHDTAGQSLAESAGIQREVPIVSSVAESLDYQPDVLAIGIAPSGGILPDAWYQEIRTAVAAGLCLVNGLHTQMAQDETLKSQLRSDQWIWDIRQEPSGLSVGSAQARSLPCKRVLTVGTDMSIGKMSTSLELDRAARQRGLRSRFLGTGQGGIMIVGDGIPLDAIRIDFATGAVEQLVLRYGEDHDILFIEGQGSLINPASTATLPLMRGAQPTHLILVHRAGQQQVHSFPHIQIPPLSAVVEMYESVVTAGGAYDRVPIMGIALNTFHLGEVEAKGAIEQTHLETGLLCTDVVRFGPDVLLDAILGL